MRTKKTNLKKGYVTRTVPFTKVNYLAVNLETREVIETVVSLIGEYTADESILALRELGYNPVVVNSIEVIETKYKISYDLLVEYGDEVK